MANYSIIYAIGSNAIRRLVVSDDPNYDYAKQVGPGEAHIVADTRQGADIFAARLAVEAATGKPSPDLLVAAIKDGVVTAMLMADPALDIVQGHELIPAYADVAVGCSYDKASDTFIKPESTIPAGIGRDGNPYPQRIEPAKPISKPSIDKVQSAGDAG